MWFKTFCDCYLPVLSFVFYKSRILSKLIKTFIKQIIFTVSIFLFLQLHICSVVVTLPFRSSLVYEKYVKLVTLVEGDPKAPFSIATTPRIPRLLHFTLDPHLMVLSAKQGSIKSNFYESLVWLDLGLNSSLPDHWWILYSLGHLAVSVCQWPRRPGFNPRLSHT